MFQALIDIWVIRRPIETQRVQSVYNRYRREFIGVYTWYTRICRSNAEKRMHFNGVIENVHRVEFPLPWGSFTGQKIMGWLYHLAVSPFPSARVSLRTNTRKPSWFPSRFTCVSFLFSPFSSLFSLSKIMHHPVAVCLHTSRATITRFSRGYRSPATERSSF